MNLYTISALLAQSVEHQTFTRVIERNLRAEGSSPP